ncbi:MAG: type IIL restriction-modification enzyme MmeI, partial [Gemmatimonadales bacterium]|nr:type IIL restriction-modification enzyme MmeI [Gemmatimonadales bacterium]
MTVVPPPRVGLADLEPALARLRHPVDVAALAATLGAVPAHEAFPLPAWLPDAPGDALVVAHGAVPWIAFRATDAAREARRLALRLQAHGRPALALALDADGGELAVAPAFGAATPLVVPLARAPGPVRQALARLRWDGAEPALPWLARAAQALGSEDVGTRFFRAFRRTLDHATGSLDRRIPAEHRHALALTALTRVLVLYFVQARGWLDGRPDFLARAVDRCLAARRRLEPGLLQPLCFGTLNRPPAERSRLARAFGRVPFLNGGLFEPNALERRWRPRLPDPVWRAAFDDLFEHFRFTASEGADRDAIAPDMLGRVFEGVMDPAERRGSGTFYTPAPLVRAVLEQAFTVHLARRLGGEAAARRALEARSPAAWQALADVTVLDPACGSGAFLLGALDLLSGVLAAQGVPAGAARRQVLARNLFGVDRNAAAVRLAELRLWLAVIAADDAPEPEAVAPLPNLDAMVRQGDSLLDPLAAVARGAAHAHTMARLGAVRRALVTAAGPAKPALVRALRATELDAAA